MCTIYRPRIFFHISPFELLHKKLELLVHHGSFSSALRSFSLDQGSDRSGYHCDGGCGLETSRQLSKQGATVVLACRNVAKGEEAAKDVGGVFVAPLDLASLQSIRDFVTAFQEKYTRLDALVNNAGIMACPYGTTKDGFEMQFGCNHLGHFALMHLLTPLLLKTAKETGKPSRFVALSSSASVQLSLLGNEETIIDFDDLNWETRNYSEESAYGQSKLCSYLHALGASQKYPPDQLISVSVHPGWVMSNLDGHVMKRMFGDNIFGQFMSFLGRSYFHWKGDMLSASDGAQTTLHCLLADDIETGKFYSQVGRYGNPPVPTAAWPLDPFPNTKYGTPENADRLWQVSLKLAGLEG